MDIKFSNYQVIEGGICAVKGFQAAGVHCGIRKNKSKLDLGAVLSDVPCHAAGCYTQNKVKGAPIIIDQKNLENGIAQAIIVNSGNANTCNVDGEEKAWKMCELAAEAMKIKPEDVIVSSTGVIGEILPIEPIQEHIPELVDQLEESGHLNAAKAIMTTDTISKEFAIEFMVHGVPCHIGGMAKGSGMIHPNMATLLCFLSSDVNISVPMLQKALKYVVDRTYNMISVDGDTSTNDTLTIMTNCKAGNPEITEENEDYEAFLNGLYVVLQHFSKVLAADGEGATKLIECVVTHAPTESLAQAVAKSVITSSLFKAAVFGEDANWGRILCAIGYTEGDFDINKISVKLANHTKDILVCKNGRGVEFIEEQANFILSGDEVRIIVNMHDGDQQATAWGCDLTYEYVKINGEYRS